MDQYHAHSTDELAVSEAMSSEALFAKEMELVLKESDKLFTGEESHGKYFDLH